ncbi:MAG: hypothetical protein WC686_05645 [Candidatus Shapirobacteria bacterium]|jgi:hypothetical protein
MIKFLALFLISALFPPAIFGQSPTVPLSSPSAILTTSPKASDIQKIREAVQQKVKEKLKEITSPANQKKAIIGKVIQSGDLSLTIDYANTPVTFSVAPDAVFIDLKRNKTSFEKIKIGQDILAMGYQDEAGHLEARRIVFITIPELTAKKYNIVTAKVVDISQSSPIIVIVPYTQKDIQFQLKIDSKTTEITNLQGNKIKLTDLTTGQKVTAIFPLTSTNSKTYTAAKIINFDYLRATSPTPTPKTPKPSN